MSASLFIKTYAGQNDFSWCSSARSQKLRTGRENQWTSVFMELDITVLQQRWNWPSFGTPKSVNQEANKQHYRHISQDGFLHADFSQWMWKICSRQAVNASNSSVQWKCRVNKILTSSTFRAWRNSKAWWVTLKPCKIICFIRQETQIYLNWYIIQRGVLKLI